VRLWICIGLFEATRLLELRRETKALPRLSDAISLEERSSCVLLEGFSVLNASANYQVSGIAAEFRHY